MFNLIPGMADDSRTEKRTQATSRTNIKATSKNLLSFTSKIGSTCDLGIQSVVLTPGGSSTCGSGCSSCSTSCCW